ncbi:hypothetical protein ACH40F_10870 [Streptomyces sp. NPDC020794]|uniref:hypothetical protein n=1 Tax=unclassified Streptomyces TaxID=2593676 RepID=UPI0036EA9848
MNSGSDGFRTTGTATGDRWTAAGGRRPVDGGGTGARLRNPWCTAGTTGVPVGAGVRADGG